MREIVAALSRLGVVSRIACFGSLAEGRDDCWSDIDLIVACDDPDASSWIAAGAIRAAKPVCFYRMFTGVDQPSGRYWFANESPFNRIDISFHSVEGYAALRQGGLKQGHAMTMKEVFATTESLNLVSNQAIHSPAAPVSIEPYETEAGRALYFHLEAVKDHLRHRQAKRDWRDTRDTLAQMVGQYGNLPFGGGDFFGLATRCLEL